MLKLGTCMSKSRGCECVYARRLGLRPRNRAGTVRPRSGCHTGVIGRCTVFMCLDSLLM